MTTHGKRVLGGLFPLVSSEGIPLEVLLGLVEQKGYVPDWHGFWKDSMKAGWNPRSTVTKILMSVGDVYGPKVKEHLSKTFEFFYEFEMASRDENEDEMKRLLSERRETDRKEQRQRLINTINTSVHSSDG